MGNFHVFNLFLHFHIFYNIPNYFGGVVNFSFHEINIYALSLKIVLKEILQMTTLSLMHWYCPFRIHSFLYSSESISFLSLNTDFPYVNIASPSHFSTFLCPCGNFSPNVLHVSQTL